MNASFIHDLGHTRSRVRQFARCRLRWHNSGKKTSKIADRPKRKGRTGGKMNNLTTAPGIVGPFAGLDVPWLLSMRAEVRRSHPFLIWAPFDAPARIWSYGEFHDRVGALAAGLVRRGIKPG